MISSRPLSRISVLIMVIVVLGLLRSTPGRAEWWNTPPNQPGFPQALTGSSIYESSPTLADLDGNSDTLEIVVAGRDRTGSTPNCQGRVYAYLPDGTKYWETQVRAPINSTPAVADVDQDDVPEVIVGLGGYIGSTCWHGGLIALNGRTGGTEWLFDTQDWLNQSPDGWLDGVYSSPAVGDVDNDGDLEVVFGAWDQCIYLLDGATGDPVWPELNGIPGQTHCGEHGFYNEDTIWSSPALADLDNNGTLEIIIGADITAGNQNGDPTGGYVYVLSHDGAILAREWLDQAIYSSPAVGDLNNNGQYEIVIGTGTYLTGKGYYVKVFNYNPSGGSVTDRLVQKWHWPTSGRVFASPALADLNGDNYLDVVVVANVGDGPEQGGANNGSKVFAWNGQTGVQMFETLICDSFGNHYAVHTSPTVAEVGRATDTGPKILFGHSWEVGILNADGTYYTDSGSCYDNETTNITYWTNYSAYASPAVGDIDGDGNVEVVIGAAYDINNPNTGRLYVWEPGRAVGTLPWPMFRHDAWHTGLYGFSLDSTPPTNPTSLVATPSPSTWTNDNTIQATWSGASDEGSGIEGYYYVWDTSPATVPGSSASFVSEAVTSVTSSPLSDGTNWYFHVRARDKAGNWADGAVHIGPFWIDTISPTSVAFSPAYTTTSSIPVQWSGSDTGSGIASYDVQVDGGTWQSWLTDVTYTTNAYSGASNHTYCFRVRAEDEAGNVETYPSGDGDTCTTVTKYMLSGTIRGNRDQPVFMAHIGATPSMSNTAYSESNGTYALFFSAQGEYVLSITRADFGSLPPVTYTLSGSRTGVDFVLPPQDDVIVNGGFEDGLQDWLVEGPPEETTTAHTGDRALDFGDSDTATQMVTLLPSTVTSPTLSLFYRVNGTLEPGDAFTVTVRSASRVVSMTLPNVTDWSHAWLDVSDLAGQPIAVTLESEIVPQFPETHMVVDEVSLGGVQPGVHEILLPLVLRQG